MKKVRLIILAIIFVALAIIASLYLIPSQKEVALINYKDKEYQKALELYEEEYRTGTLTIDTATHLVGVYLQYAEIDKAVAVMERFVSENPNHLDAHIELGKLYKYAQRPEDYLANLEKVNALSASDEYREKLSEAYTIDQNTEKNIPLMIQAVMKDGQSNPQEFKDLVRLLAAGKRYDEALEILARFREKFPEKMDFSDHELALRLYVDTNRLDEARAYALSLHDMLLKPGEISRTSSILLYQVSPDAAFEFIKPYKQDIDKSDDLFSQYVSVLSANNHSEEAYALLKSRYDAGSLPRGLNDELLLLAALSGNDDLAETLVDDLDYEYLEEGEIIALIETAMVYHKPRLLTRLRGRAEAIAEQNDDDYLKAIIMIVGGDKGTINRIVKTLNEEPSFAKRLQLARLCARQKLTRCTDAFSAKLPPAESLSDTDVIATTQLLQSTRQYDAAYDYITTARTARQSQILDSAWFPLAALKSNNDVIRAFLSNDPEHIGQQSFTNAYYLAADNRRFDNAGDIAEYLYNKDTSLENRKLITQTYLRGKRYEDAIALLREDKDESIQAENDYLFVLAKLARRNAIYANELSDYGINALNSNLSTKRRQTIIYALVDGGQQHTVMPYIRDLALAKPSEWAFLYANYLKKRSGAEAARDFWMQVANRHNENDTLRKQIAYNLYEEGYKEDAGSIFKTLAANESADSDLVNQLLYLWGPLYNEEALSWLDQRAAYAKTPQERQAWLKLIAEGVTDAQLTQLASVHPELLQQADVETRYLDIMRRHSTDVNATKTAFANYATPRIEQSHNVEQLVRYAEYASSYNLDAIEKHAYARGLQLDPNNAALLARLGVTYYGEADYSRSEELLSHYFELDPATHPATLSSFYRPEFYYAEILRRERKLEAAQPYYQRLIDIATDAPDSDVQLHSMAARAYAYSGDAERGMNLYQGLITANPDNRQLKADYSAMLIELKQYEQANASFPTWKETPVASGESLVPLSLSALNAAGYRLVDNNTKILILRDETREFIQPDTERYKWLGYAREGYKETLLVANGGYGLQVMNSADGGTWLHPIKLKDGDSIALNEAFATQHELMNARVEVETGDSYDASRRMRTLLKKQPDDPQVLGFAANVENFLGNWPYARKLINKAHDIQPGNEDIIELQRGIEREHAASIYIDGEWRGLSDNDEFITTVGGTYDVHENLQVGIVGQNNKVDSQLIRRANGDQGEFSDDKQRGEIFLRYFTDEGTQTQLSLYGNNDTPGLGLHHMFINPFGNTRLSAELRRPYWELVEGILDDATRDRLAIGHRTSLSNKTVIDGEIGYNIYNTDEFNNISSTVTVTGNISHRIHELPFVAVGYGLDAEYEIDEENGIDTNGIPFQRFPLDSREVHSINILGNHAFDEDTVAEGLASFGVDRISGNAGPAIEGRITHYMTDRLAVQGRAAYGFRGGADSGDVTRAGLRLQYRY